MKFSYDGTRVRNFKVTRCYRGLIVIVVYVKHGNRLRIGSSNQVASCGILAGPGTTRRIELCRACFSWNFQLFR